MPFKKIRVAMNRTNFFFLIACMLLTTQLNAQNLTDKVQIVSQTDVDSLNKMAEDSRNVQIRYKNKIVPEILVDKNGNREFFSHFESDGTAIYYELENENAAISSDIDEIRSGGVAGLELDGTGLNIGLWDGGRPRPTHQELEGKIIINDAASLDFHATHVAGILVASGIVPEARGMAPGATVESFTSSGVVSEVAAWASEGGMITNHSYITANPREQYQLYGIYNVHSRNWDTLSYDAPYLIMCTGASNNGRAGYNPDGSRYDLLASNKLGKNAIVVGACNNVLNYTGPESVTQAIFTSWGPTDDWRIKPDLAAVGTMSFSTRAGSDDDYATGNGSSFASPVVAGGLALLQQHFHNLNDVYMKAVTAKALILSTADEAGEFDGPDFANGWGLFNARRAADVITSNGTTSEILELNLNQNEVFTKTITVDGTQPLSVAICWNDPASEPLPNASFNDPTLMLINDLDVRVFADGVEFFPWKMEPNSTFDNYTAPAEKGDNYRDNTEIIHEKNVPAGEYTIMVTHKNELQSGGQDFSMVINGIQVGPPSQVQVVFNNQDPEDVLTTFGGGVGFPQSRSVVGDDFDTIATPNPSDSWLVDSVDFSMLVFGAADAADDDQTFYNGVQVEVSLVDLGDTSVFNDADNSNGNYTFENFAGARVLGSETFILGDNGSFGVSGSGSSVFQQTVSFTNAIDIGDGVGTGISFKFSDTTGGAQLGRITVGYRNNGASPLPLVGATSDRNYRDGGNVGAISGAFGFSNDIGLAYAINASVNDDFLLGDANLDGEVSFLDISPFIATLSSGEFLDQADMDRNGEVNFLDISPFIAILSGQ